MKIKIPFNKPYLIGKELDFIKEAILSGKISGNGDFTQKCHNFFIEKYNLKKVLLTTSCTDALEMAAILIDIKPGDEVIIPSFTFVSTANAFILRGAKIVFADSEKETPNIDVDKIEELITPKTKAIVPVHYAGVSCKMDKILSLARKYNLYIVEDAAQAIDSYFNGKPLGSLGHLAAFSFHETKNIISGEGGMLVINDESFFERAEIIWEKGTNRAKFFRGEVDKYGWVDIGSSFLPSEITSAFLYAQLLNIEKIQKKRISIWNKYYEKLKSIENKGLLKLPVIPSYATNNAHMFYIICNKLNEQEQLISFLKENGILATFHYLPLHKSPYYNDKHDGRELPMAEFYSNHIVRLPLFFDLTNDEQDEIINLIYNFYRI